MLGILLTPPRLALRALDDLHSLAEAATRVPAIERALMDRLDAVISGVEAIDRHVVEMGDALASQFGDVDRHVVQMGDSLDGSIGGLGDSLAPELVRNREGVEAMHKELKESLEPLPDLIGDVREGVRGLDGQLAGVRETVEPLQPAAERIGRIADRLPGSSRGK